MVLSLSAFAARARRTWGSAHRPPGPVLLAGGGTVGHLSPGIALREALAERGIEARLATPGEARERSWFPEGEPPPVRMPALRRPGRAGEVPLFPGRLSAAVVEAMGVIRREQPRLVVGLGGWPCVPASLAAAACRVPLAFLASDQSPGVVVRRLAPLAARIYVAQAEAAQGLPPSDRVLVVGPILRASIRSPRRDPAHFGLQPGLRTLFVTGGSLGARGLNDRVVAGFRDALRDDPGLRHRIQVLHSTGPTGDGIVAAYRELGLVHHVRPFVREMEVAWGSADLALTRAGAITCAELAATGTPAVLVPYPHHADRQQFANAAVLVERGGAVLVEEADLVPGRFRETVLGLLEDAPRLEVLRARMGSGFRDGAGQIADDLVRFLGGGPSPGRGGRVPAGGG